MDYDPSRLISDMVSWATDDCEDAAERVSRLARVKTNLSAAADAVFNGKGSVQFITATSGNGRSASLGYSMTNTQAFGVFQSVLDEINGKRVTVASADFRFMAGF